jgi:hypothetical protein
MPKFTLVTVLPSPGQGLVTNITFGGRSAWGQQERRANVAVRLGDNRKLGPGQDNFFTHLIVGTVG